MKFKISRSFFAQNFNGVLLKLGHVFSSVPFREEANGQKTKESVLYREKHILNRESILEKHTQTVYIIPSGKF